MVAACNLSSGHFLHRNGLARHHRLIDCRAAFDHGAIHRNSFAWADTQTVTDPHLLQRHIRLTTILFTRLAVFGARPSNAFIAEVVWLRARNSSTCPSKTSTVITAAASK